MEPAGYVVRESSSAADAVAVVYAESPEFVLVGLSVPDLDGEELVRRVRDEYGRRAGALIALYAADPLDPRAFAIDFDSPDLDVVRWPLDPSELTARREAAFHAPGPVDADRAAGIPRDVAERPRADRETQAERSRYGLIAENSPDVIALVSADGKLEYISPALKSFCGYAPAELVGRSAVAYVHPDDQPKVVGTVQRVIHSGQAAGIDHRVRRKQGGQVWVETVIRPIDGQGAGTPRLLFVTRDATNRKLTEDALRENEEQFRAIFEAAGVGIALSDTEGRWLQANRAARNMLFLSDAGFFETTADAITHPDDRLPMRHITESVLCGDLTSFHGEARFLRQDGQVVSVDLSITCLRNDVGDPKALMWVLSDITGRKTAEDDFRRSEERFRAICDQSPTGIYIHQDEKLVYANPAIGPALGIDPDRLDEIAGRSYLDFVHPSDRDRVQAIRHARRADGLKSSSFRILLVGSSGAPVPVEIIETTIELDGRPATMGTVIDLSERDRASREMAALEEQLQQSQKMEAVGRLAGGVAHDFNNILTVISNYSALLSKSVSPEDAAWSDVFEIRKAAERGGQLTHQLLAFSRKQIIEPRVLDLNLLVQDSLKMLRRVIKENVELTFERDDALARVKADPGQVNQILLNLAVNARDAMPEGGTVRIQVENRTLDRDYCHRVSDATPGEKVCMTVSDTGHGMPEQTLKRIFEPFFTTKSEEEGTGLGLSTVYGIVRQHGGHVEVESTEGAGTRFRVFFPATDEVDIDEDDMQAPESNRGSETILLVEDNQQVRRVVRRLLERRGYRVFEAIDGLEALGAFEENGDSIDMLITDVVMPHINGRALVETLRETKPELKVLFMSGYLDDIPIMLSHEEFGKLFIQKPFNPKIFAKKVREILDQA